MNRKQEVSAIMENAARMEIRGEDMHLNELAERLVTSRLVGDGNMIIQGVQTDSRKVTAGDLFICITGNVYDGHAYATEAVAKGAVAVVVERDVEVEVPKLFVKDCRQAMGVIAGHYYDYPSRSLKLIGVTGTNGKTTITFLIDKILMDQGFRTGLLGTIHTKIGNKTISAERTTQEALDLQRTLRTMVDEQVQYCTMEVSSHALELGRVKGCRFRSALFTNLTQDHLDYHVTMERYRDAKGLLFSRMGNDYDPDLDLNQYAILNADDLASEHYAQLTSAQVITYGIEKAADVRARDIRVTLSGTSCLLDTFAGSIPLHMKLIGKFNVYNALGAIASTLVEGIPLDRIVHSLEEIDPVDGRMQTVNVGQDYLVLVDYAHTPDGLDNALRSVSEFAQGRIITVFGCGGDRDRTKRPIMGGIAAQYSDMVIITSDNPRTEDPEAIVMEVAQGVKDSGYSEDRYAVIVDRAEAIKRAVSVARTNDVVLIAGKGHETYQILNDRTIDFDDRIVATEAIRGIKL
jgi:UDP-N-acetylmuramoyl-L-alanyl-D-glutamate--2,6-diaminopimelate ligase